MVLDIKKVIKDYNFIYFLLLSFCLGSFFVNLSTVICLIIFAIRYNTIKIYIHQFKILFYLLIVFWIIFFTSTITNSSDDIKVILKSFAYLRFIILPFVVIYMMDRIDRKKFIIFLNLIIIFLILDIFFQYYFNVDFFGYRLEELGNPRMDRISGFFGYELIAGTYLSLFGFLALFLLKEANVFSKKKYIYFIYFIFLILAILVTGDRVGLLFIFGIILFNLIFNNNLRKYFLLFFLTFSILGTVVIKNNEKLYERYIDIFAPVKNTKIFTNPSFDGIINSPWVSHYLVSWIMVKEKPLSGFGNRGFRKYCSEFINKEQISNYKRKCTTHPHNTYFEILVETGLIGFIVFVFFNLNIFVKVLKISNQNIFLIYSVIFAILNPLRPSGSFFTTWTGGIFWVILGILLYYMFRQLNPSKTKN
jgi:O-antigen ligase